MPLWEHVPDGEPRVFEYEGRGVYAYWGFCECCCAELNEDMATVKPGTLRVHAIGHCKSKWTSEVEHHDPAICFFFASDADGEIADFDRFTFDWENE